MSYWFEEAFRTLFNTALAAGWLILAVLLIRWIFRRRAPRWVMCLLWGLCGLRLVWFFTVPSPLSILPSAETVPENIVFAETPAVNTGVAPIDRPVNALLGEYLAPVPEASIHPMQVVSLVAGVIWLTGLCLLLLFATVSCLRLRRRLALAVRADISELPEGVTPFPRGASVWFCETVDSPFVFGVFRPRIYLPYGLDAAVMREVLTHERAHLTRLDHVTKLLAFGLLCVYWFDPLVWVAYCLYVRDVELACDERILRTRDDRGRAAYAEALLVCGTDRHTLRAVTPLAFGEVGVRTRIRSALSYKKPLLWVLVAVLVAAVVLAVCFFTSPQDTQDRSEGVTYLPGIQGVYGESSLDDFGTELVSFRRDVSGGFTVQLRFADRSLPSGTRGAP